MPLLCPVLKEHYWLASKSGLDAVYHEGSAQRDSHDTYDLNDTRNHREQRDTVTDYSECLLMGATLASPLNLFNGFPNRYWLQWMLLPDARSEASHNCHGGMLILYWLQWTFCWLQWMFAAVYLKASCILLITVNVKVNLLTALLMYTIRGWCMTGWRATEEAVARKVWSLHDSRPRRHTLMQNRIASVYLLLSTDSYYDPVGTPWFRTESLLSTYCWLLTTVNVCAVVLLLMPLLFVMLLTIVNVYCFLDLLITVNVYGLYASVSQTRVGCDVAGVYSLSRFRCFYHPLRIFQPILTDYSERLLCPAPSSGSWSASLLITVNVALHRAEHVKRYWL